MHPGDSVAEGGRLSAMKDSAPVLRVLLVGFMGSGKTQVGQALARRLGWRFRDFDQEIRSRVGLPIPEIFRQHGEGRFREVEEAVGAELLLEEGVVLASGGGWPEALGRMESLPEGTFSVWLQVEAEEAARTLSLKTEQVERVYKDIDAKRETTSYQHMPPLLVGAVDEIKVYG